MKGHFLIIGVLLFIISILISLNIFFQQSLQMEIAQEFSKQQQLISELIARNIGDFVRLRKERVLYTARLLSAIERDNALDMDKLTTEIRSSRHNVVANFGIINRKGEVIHFEGDKKSLRTLTKDIIKTALELPDGKVQLIELPTVVYFLTSVHPRNGSTAAVFLSIDIREIIARFTSKLDVMDKGDIWIMDGKGTLLYHAIQPSMVGRNIYDTKESCMQCHKSFAIEKNVISAASMTGKFIAPSGEDKILSFARTGDDLSWIVFVSSPFSDIAQMTKQSMRFYSYLIMSILVTTIVVSTALIAFNRKRIQAEEIAKRQSQMEKHAAELEEKVNERTAELFQEKEKLNSIVSAIGSGILLLDKNGMVQWANQLAEEMAGSKLVGRSCEELCAECEISSNYSRDNIETVLASNLFGKQGQHYQVTTAPIRGADGNTIGYVRLIHDVTEIKKMEEQMSNSEKLASIGRLAAGIAHEIGNPLTSVFSFVQILREMELDEFKKESLQTIYFHINRISETLKQLSGYSKMPPVEPKHCQINDVIETSVNLIQYDKRAKDILIRKELSTSLPKICVDANQLSQVFVNLILNAIDAMPDGGKLIIRSYQKAGSVFIEFIDTGMGIPKENLIKIFDPFYTTKEKGTGLGLAVSYNIIKKMNGALTVDSEPGVGTTFTIEIPFGTYDL
ncbi:MAG TPA: ATP-binding protein [Dissulfurispiraceae bacterium]|nr:ATP-binding protein [Dissulfurispiraceae bacterium]